MNKLDIHFKNLITSLKVLSPDAILDNIKTNYLKVDDYNKKAIERFLAQFNYWGKLNYEEEEFEELQLRAEVLKNHVDDFDSLFDKLGDYRSKKVLYGILNYWYNSDFNSLAIAYEGNYSQYFDLD